MLSFFSTQVRKIVKGIKFPVPQKSDGFYPAILSDQGNIRCPNCGCPYSWSIKQYSNITCNTCHTTYRNLGVFGLDKIAN